MRSECVTRYASGEDQSHLDFVRYAYRPFDTRWLYWEAETKLLDENAPTTSHMC